MSDLRILMTFVVNNYKKQIYDATIYGTKQTMK